MSLWWIWAVLALGLAALELIVPGYIFLGVAIGAAGVALILGLGIGPWGTPLTLLVFAILSLIAFLVLRRVFGLHKGPVKTWTDDING